LLTSCNVAVAVAAAVIRGGCKRCHNNIPAVTDTFNESTLLFLCSGWVRSVSSIEVVDVVEIALHEMDGGMRTNSVQDLATRGRNPCPSDPNSNIVTSVFPTEDPLF
jgi:hypothetical protein